MASIYRAVILSVSAESVWDRLRDFYAVHERLVPGFVTECRPEPGARVITFFNGLVARELLVGLDEQVRRVSYAVIGGTAMHHSASAQVFAEGQERCRLVWITDVLPNEMAEPIGQMMDRGAAVMKATLETAD
jgi:Polyketide cyclase / dehydrase and lipid transport